MRRFLYVFLATLLSCFIFGQTEQVEVKGKVISSMRQSVYHAELFLRVKDSVFKTVTNENGEYNFSVKKSKAVAELYINSNTKTIGGATKRSCFLVNKAVYNINLAEKLESTYDFELKLAGMDYSTPSILFKSNSADVILDVKYSKTSAKIEEVIDYFYKLTQQYPKMVLNIDGTISSNEKAKGISLMRAKYVAGLLIKKGVPANNIKCNGRGTSLPDITDREIKIAKSKAEEETLHAMNRRVIIKILTLGEGVVGDREIKPE